MLDPNSPATTVTASSAPTTRSATWRGRIRALLLRFYKPSRSLLVPSFGTYLLMRPAVFELWFRARAWWWLATRGGVRSVHPADNPSGSFLDGVRSYNHSQLWEFYRIRTEKFMAVLRCVDQKPRAPRMLVIGPRNEAELLLLSLYGFPLDSITAIDLFSYSPLVRCMDMHRLEFPDGSFDIVYSAWTLKYSYDLRQACSEIVRVLRPGGLVVTGFSHTAVSSAEVGAPLPGGLDELLGAFAPHVGWVYWKESSPVAAGAAEEVSVIFRVDKQ